MYTLNCKGRIVSITRPLVMGIINITPDSFYAGSRVTTIDDVLKQADRMLTEGADLLDIGGQSTRPGSERISADEEKKRVIAPLEKLVARFPNAVVSIDTFYSAVARDAVNAGAAIINDVSAGSIDPEMLAAVVDLRVPYVLMHMQGTPLTMQLEPRYENVTREVLDFFIQKKNELNRAGVIDVIIDPGFGFGKTRQHNFELLRNLSVFKMLDAPILLGISRKSMVTKTLGIKNEEALNGTTVLNTIGVMNGASIIRVHDVMQAREAVRLYEETFLDNR